MAAVTAAPLRRCRRGGHRRRLRRRTPPPPKAPLGVTAMDQTQRSSRRPLRCRCTSRSRTRPWETASRGSRRLRQRPACRRWLKTRRQPRTCPPRPLWVRHKSWPRTRRARWTFKTWPQRGGRWPRRWPSWAGRCEAVGGITGALWEGGSAPCALARATCRHSAGQEDWEVCIASLYPC
ncbi:hypothetical protein BU14_0129s0005 [Porphyra umbilicalis]|uniref:Uncharacterized protein n=1 Tax=Porphyra umbilicalis TaxID=2786 RepID=A0A1X6PAF3_PORUM|nr:hypothetical protein BU14_0129s0005 [Porphyra umbilicalis]|eukprot:OSX77889.1 hypothetical protein BU14_0129s0005 [Porphyra umbilicalis]